MIDDRKANSSGGQTPNNSANHIDDKWLLTHRIKAGLSPSADVAALTESHHALLDACADCSWCRGLKYVHLPYLSTKHPQ